MFLLRIFTRLVKILRTICFCLIFVVCALIIIPLIFLFLSIFRLGTKEVNCKILCFFIRIWFWASGISVQAEGIENLKGNRGLIMAANHQSLIDPMIIMSILCIPFNTLIADGIFRVPIPAFYYTLKKSGFIPIFGTFKGDFEKTIEQILAILKKDGSVLIFPEGITTLNGSLRIFKLGTAQLAIRSEKPVLPIAISGAFETFPPIDKLFLEVLTKTGLGRTRFGMLIIFIKIISFMLFGFNPRLIRVKFGKPMDFSEFKNISLEDFRQVTDKIHTEISNMMASM